MRAIIPVSYIWQACEGIYSLFSVYVYMGDRARRIKDGMGRTIVFGPFDEIAWTVKIYFSCQVCLFISSGDGEELL